MAPPFCGGINSWGLPKIPAPAAGETLELGEEPMAKELHGEEAHANLSELCGINKINEQSFIHKQMIHYQNET